MRFRLKVRIEFLPPRLTCEERNGSDLLWSASVPEEWSTYLGSHAQSNEQAADKKLLPRLAESLGEDGEADEDAGKEEHTTTTEQVVERVGQEYREEANDHAGTASQKDLRESERTLR